MSDTAVARPISEQLTLDLLMMKRFSVSAQMRLRKVMDHLRTLAKAGYEARFNVRGELHDYALTCSGTGKVQLAYLLSSPAGTTER